MLIFILITLPLWWLASYYCFNWIINHWRAIFKLFAISGAIIIFFACIFAYGNEQQRQRDIAQYNVQLAEQARQDQEKEIKKQEEIAKKRKIAERDMLDSLMGRRHID